MTDIKANLESARSMMDSVPRLDADAKRLAVELYKQLALGEPVPIERLCDALGAPIEEITVLLQDEQLKGWVFYDDEGRVIGFRGLAVREMPHRFEVDGTMLYSWCAIDSLFIPELLGQSAKVESRDPGVSEILCVSRVNHSVTTNRSSKCIANCGFA